MLNILIMTIIGCVLATIGAFVVAEGNLQGVQLVSAYFVGGLVGASLGVLRVEWSRFR